MIGTSIRKSQLKLYISKKSITGNCCFPYSQLFFRKGQLEFPNRHFHFISVASHISFLLFIIQSANKDIAHDFSTRLTLKTGIGGEKQISPSLNFSCFSGFVIPEGVTRSKTFTRHNHCHSTFFITTLLLPLLSFHTPQQQRKILHGRIILCLVYYYLSLGSNNPNIIFF